MSDNNNEWRAKRIQMQQTGKLPEGEPPAPPPEPEVKRTFKSWFENVFWFRYRLVVLIGLAVLAVLSVFVYDLVTRKLPDLSYVFATEGSAAVELLDDFTALCSEVSGDSNADGETIILPQVLVINEESEMGMANRQKLMVLYVDEDISLFIWDAAIEEQMRDQGEGFENLLALGLPAEPDRPWVLRVDVYPEFQHEILDAGPYYATVQMLPDKRLSDPKYAVPHEKCIEILRALVAER